MDGYKLPRGTRVYFWDIDQYPTSHILKDSYTYPIFSPEYHTYVYMENDSLWATNIVRDYWKRNPQFHPNATLFDILYSKLDMKNYTIQELCWFLL